MIFNGKDVADFLVQKGINHIHHANTFQTAVTFLKQKALLSRQEVANRNLYQTPQESDDSDKKYGIYNDIFFDVENLSARMSSNLNKYGPITFRYDVRVLNDLNVKISKDNPLYFDRIEPNNRYITNSDEINYEEYNSWPFKHHIMVANTPCIGFQLLNTIFIYKPTSICDQSTKDALLKMDVDKKISMLIQTCKDLSPSVNCEVKDCYSTKQSDREILSNSWG